MKKIAFVLGLILAQPAFAETEWQKVNQADISKGAEFIAVGSDGFLYSIDSNEDGFVLKSLRTKYKFQPADQWTGDILAGNAVAYLGKTCDALFSDIKGVWTNDSTGLNVAFSTAPDQAPLMSWRFLDTDIASEHDC